MCDPVSERRGCIYCGASYISRVSLMLLLLLMMCIYVPTNNRSVLLCLVVEKVKKCLDFTVTLFICHLIACSCYEVSLRRKIHHLKKKDASGVMMTHNCSSFFPSITGLPYHSSLVGNTCRRCCRHGLIR